MTSTVVPMLSTPLMRLATAWGAVVHAISSDAMNASTWKLRATGRGEVRNGDLPFCASGAIYQLPLLHG